MIVYWIVAVCLILNLVNPRLLWYIDAWKYKDSKKEEPSSAYIILSRSIFRDRADCLSNTLFHKISFIEII